MLIRAALGGLVVAVMFIGGLAVLGKLEGTGDVIFGLVFGLVCTVSNYLWQRRRSTPNT